MKTSPFGTFAELSSRFSANSWRVSVRQFVEDQHVGPGTVRTSHVGRDDLANRPAGFVGDLPRPNVDTLGKPRIEPENIACRLAEFGRLILVGGSNLNQQGATAEKQQPQHDASQV